MDIYSSGIKSGKGVVAAIATGPRSTYAPRRMSRASLMQAGRRYEFVPMNSTRVGTWSVL